MNETLVDRRKKYFASLFSIFIWFAVLILLRVPLNPNFSFFSPAFLVILLTAFIPSLLIFKKKSNYNLTLILAYIPALVGFITSIIFNNSVYFLISFPIFLLGYIIIFPKR
ncbi:hypothetical protein [Sulfurihydrogenibium azorense]|uniref:Putative NADH dehydrogenase subunit 6 n=1 Tax=Sulfurihydrogenibium azorense (strain DSM 15241 / OCM 825 / Az-Fu1) TaxID=204536 RepID=C1DT00_SULAA|nr:hypothetical protein [Sulfurihydrogenibium azorense]ACN98312.1 putative NADH dehydrogenase subunit 6 [Sulfurihydrogenibium azorense Az-Fu1]MDM7273502.1 hypothetical protein [Sulfurihydrogenibium azorense]